MQRERVVVFLQELSIMVCAMACCDERLLKSLPVSDLLYQALERLESCECEEGCPSCKSVYDCSVAFVQ